MLEVKAPAGEGKRAGAVANRRATLRRQVRGGKCPRNDKLPTPPPAPSPAAKAQRASGKAKDSDRVRLARKLTTGPRFPVGSRCTIVRNGMTGYHDVTLSRPELRGRTCTVERAPVYPDTWYLVRVDGGSESAAAVKVRASSLVGLGDARAAAAAAADGERDATGDEACEGDDATPAGEAVVVGSPSSFVNVASPTPPTSPETAVRADADADADAAAAAAAAEAEEDALESFVHANGLDPDAAQTRALLRVARDDIAPGLVALVARRGVAAAAAAGGDGGPAWNVDSEGDVDDNDAFTILSPAAVGSVQRHLNAGRYPTFKAFVSDVRRLFAYAWQLPPTEEQAWRIQVAESWFDSALIVASDAAAARRHRGRVADVPEGGPATHPRTWPGSSTQLTATLSFDCGDRASEVARIVAALARECGGATPALVISS